MVYANLFRGLRFALGAAAMLGVFTWTGSGFSASGIGTAAYAAADPTTLAPDQIAAIQQCLKTQLGNIDPSLTGPARDAAVQNALKLAVNCAVPAYGPGALSVLTAAALNAGIPVPQAVSGIILAATASGIDTAEAVADVELGAVSGGASATLAAEAIIALTAQNQLTNEGVGKGLGEAAALLADKNPTAANQIAQVVSNEGTRPMGEQFAAAVTANGGPQQLADAGLQNPNAIGESGGANNGASGAPGFVPYLGNSGTALPSCNSPSCT
jgi:hypothetical protein